MLFFSSYSISLYWLLFCQESELDFAERSFGSVGKKGKELLIKKNIYIIQIHSFIYWETGIQQ